MNVYSHTTGIELDLYAHQLSSLDFLLSNPTSNMLVYQKMGYGKTMIGSIFSLIASSDTTQMLDRKIFILAPNKVVLDIWSMELNKAMCYIPFNHNIENIILMTIQQFNDSVSKFVTHEVIPPWVIEKYSNTVFIVDEAHKILDNNTERVFLNLRSAKCSFRLILITATPIVNTPETLISLIKLISGRVVDRSSIYEKGVFVYQNRINDDIDKVIEDNFRDSALYYFPQDDLGLPLTVEMGEYIEPYTIHKLIPCVMNGNQLTVYNKTIAFSANDMFLKDPINSQFFTYKDFFTPQYIYSTLESIKNSGGGVKQLSLLFDEEVLKRTTNTYNTKADCIVGDIYTGVNLLNSSSKFYKLIELLPVVGKCIIFFQNVEYGSPIIRSIMNSNGVSEYSSDYTPDNGLCSKCCKPHKQMSDVENNSSDVDGVYGGSCVRYGGVNTSSKSIKHRFNQARFIILTGSRINSTGDHNELISIANDVDNMEGDYIKYVFISEAFSIAYSFFHFNSVHILTPRNTENELKQTIARTVRKFKTSGSKSRPRVDIYLYCAMFPSIPPIDGSVTKDKSLESIHTYLDNNSSDLTVDFKKYLYMELKNNEILRIENAFARLSSVEYKQSANEYIKLLHKVMIVKVIFKTEVGMYVPDLITKIKSYNSKLSITQIDISQVLKLGIYVNNTTCGNVRVVEIAPNVVAVVPQLYLNTNPSTIQTRIYGKDVVSYNKPLNYITMIRSTTSGIIRIKIGSRSGINIASIHRSKLLKILRRLDPTGKYGVESNVGSNVGSADTVSNIESNYQSIMSKTSVINKIIEIFEKLKVDDPQKIYIIDI